MPTVQDLAREAAGCFETATRADGTEYVRLRDANEESTGAPDWVRNMVYTAHAGCLPDDWKEEYGPSDQLWMANRIMLGQYMEASEIYSLVLAELEKLAGKTACAPRFRIGGDDE